MGKGGEMQPSAEPEGPILRKKSTRVPTEKPPFTIGELKKAIPPHCFKRSLARSCSYLVGDLVIMAVLFQATRFFHHPVIPTVVTYGLLWPLYWIMQGSVATGVWVIAHECGHQAFCEYGWLNDAVGLVFHSALLVPYFSWKYSHRRHHSSTGSIDKDEVFVPKTEEEAPAYEAYVQLPAVRLMLMLATWVLGWPLYLAFNVTGRKYEGAANHFNPKSPIFNERERFYVFVSDVALAVAVWALVYCASIYGTATVIMVYGIPLLIVNGFLVTITYLQHTHRDLPHFDSSEWEWLRGAMATVDRDYGVLNHVLHHITDTHVAHHLFSTMPHYHAMEATNALKPVLKEYYKFDATPVLQAMWREFGECRFVAPDEGAPEGVVWYKPSHKTA